ARAHDRSAASSGPRGGRRAGDAVGAFRGRGGAASFHAGPEPGGVLMTPAERAAPLDLRSGEMVEVRSAHEILATLDERGAFDALPFMPEMLRFCGRRFQVQQRADKTCDTITMSGGRRMHGT